MIDIGGWVDDCVFGISERHNCDMVCMFCLLRKFISSVYCRRGELIEWKKKTVSSVIIRAHIWHVNILPIHIYSTTKAATLEENLDNNSGGEGVSTM